MIDILNGIVTTFFTLLMGFINIVVTPIDNYIMNNIPALGDIVSQIADFFSYISNLIPWAVSYLGLLPGHLNQMVIVITFKLFLVIFDDGIKFAVKWYNALKP